ncbi:hypothetical protein [Halobacteriovorax sp. HLS]|uniref:hypothetical protein n=1 Tax=Halobacteriovorax sp. HLS TaxID=2234000 RepID=UPI000FDBD2A7|nr:hypothetical protein [Halobacteriovorax sp. HLS]
MKILSIALCTILMLFSFNSSSCESVDDTLMKYDVGLVSHLDVLEAVQCNFKKFHVSNGVCGTRVGIKEDVVSFRLKQYDVGLITKAEVEKAKDDLKREIQKCN